MTTGPGQGIGLERDLAPVAEDGHTVGGDRQDVALGPAPEPPVLGPPEEAGEPRTGRTGQLPGVKRLVRRSLVFGLPFMLYASFIFVADPFDFVNSRSPIDGRLKELTARQLNPAFWKMNQFDRRPVPNILLGDSRMFRLDPNDIKAVTGEDYFNFAYGGGTLREAIDTFWFAAERVKLQKVYLGVSLETYNETNYGERTKLFPAVNANPALYFVNKTVLLAAVYDVYSQLTGTDLKLGEPPMDRAAFWPYHLQHILTPYYARYVYPTKYKTLLTELARHCEANSVRLTFVIFPSSLDAQRLIHTHKLDEENAQMRRDLAALAPVYDFDYVNDITARRENFTDPVHFTTPIEAQLIREIWGGEVRYARKF